MHRLANRIANTSAPGQRNGERYLEPAWDIALLFPAQGAWSEEDYLNLDTNQLVEFSHGHIEVLEMPSRRHQLIVFFLARWLFDFLAARALGTVLFAPYRVRLWAGKIREPDIVFVSNAKADRMHEQYSDGADLIIEVVSGDHQHDLIHKRREYAEAGIPEYWIVDPEVETITVLRLADGRYAEHGVFRRGDHANSPSLLGLALPVSETFDAGRAVVSSS